MKWIISVLAFLFLTSCNDQGTDSRFSDILSKPPYAVLTDSIQDQPQNDALYFRRAVLLNNNNLPEPALEDFQKAWSLKKNEEYAIGVARILQDKNADSEIMFLLEATNVLPESIYLHFRLAKAYDAKNKTDEAIRVCDQILQADSLQLNTMILKADLLKKKNDLNGAVSLLEKVNRELPDNFEIAKDLAYNYAETKNPKTITFSDMMIKRDSMKLLAAPFYVKGVYYTNIGENEKAIQQFDLAIQRDHRLMEAYLEKGKILLNQKKITEALKTFNLLITINPAYPDAWYWIGQCMEKLGEKEDAILNYEKAYSLDKTFTEAKEAIDRLK